MRIKKLELTGFKSFKSSTVIYFDGGITGVVGPNGCGKSNIVDALVWVMGEMSPKHLRGSSMEDVIFAGATGHAPSGFCEVSLVLEKDGAPFPVQYMDRSEIMISRRLHRSGESEYLINKKPCRLRDIQEIFMDTGSGARGFSIIEQGTVGQIVTARPEQRRGLIEEAAGISKFKARKRETERKLKSTEDNLLRLQDIRGELKRQLGGLEKQSQKAQRYRELKKDLEDGDLWLSSRQFLQLQEEQKEFQAQYEEARDLLSSFQTQQVQIESQLEEIKGCHLEEEKKNQTLFQNLEETRNHLSQCEVSQRELERTLEQAQNAREVSGTLMEEAQGRSEILSRNLTQALDNESRIQKELETVREKADLQEAALFSKKKDLSQREKELSQKRKELTCLSQDMTEAKSRKGALVESLLYLNQKKEEWVTQINSLEESLGKSHKAHRNSLKKYEGERQVQMEILNHVGDLQGQKNQLAEELEIKQKEILNLKDQLGEVSSRLEGLRGLQDNFEGFQEGARSILLWQKEKQKKGLHGGGLPQTFTPVSDLVSAPRQYELALEAALGSRLQMLVGGDNEESLKALHFLKEKKSGRSTFYSELGAVQTVDSSERSLLKSCSGVRAFLDDVVQVRGFKKSVQKLLSQVVIVEGIEEAWGLQSQFPSWTFVSLEGDLLTPEGVMSGGHSGDLSSGVLQRQREIEELSLLKEERLGKLALLEGVLKKLKARLSQVSERLESSLKKQLEKEIFVSGLKKDLEGLTRAISEKETNLNQSLSQMDEVLKIQTTKEQDSIKLESQISDFTQREKKLQSFLEESSNLLDQARIEVEKQQDIGVQLQLKQVSLEQELLGSEKEKKGIQSSLDEITQRIEEMGRESFEKKILITHQKQNQEKQKLKLQELVFRLKAQEEQASEQRKIFEAQSAEIFQLQEKLSQGIQQKGECQSLVNEKGLILEKNKMQTQSLLESVAEHYQKDLSVIFREYMEKPGEPQEMKERVGFLKKKLSGLGQVSLSAIEDYHRCKERCDFLDQQFLDLTSAKNQLVKVMDRINRTCSKRFKETFDQVNQGFEKVFPNLFGGGQARLVLIDEEEGGELGVDIVAKPPGKKLQNLSLLSGGEKALTAVSLIFAIFLIKPSPYCLLDEVDAPLDDANVLRFNDLVREMSRRSQIILVTHNKQTMEIAEKLYGVTMEEKGVSKMVSVELGT